MSAVSPSHPRADTLKRRRNRGPGSANAHADSPRHEKKKFEFVGVAPAADLIVVKMFYLFKDPEQNGVALPFERLLEDAISYAQRVAKADSRSGAHRPA